MNIFHIDAEALDPVDVRLAQALADIATVGLLQHRAISRTRELAPQLQTALNSRITIEQAKGMVSARRRPSAVRLTERRAFLIS